MKTQRTLDRLLDTARTHTPVDRLVERDEITSILDGARPAIPSVPEPSTRINWRLTMAIPSLLLLTGIALFGLLGGDEPKATPEPAERHHSTIDTSATTREARFETSEAADGATTTMRTSAAASRPGDDRASLRLDIGAPARRAERVERAAPAERGDDRAAAAELEEARARHAAAGSLIQSAQPSDGEASRDIPSGGMRFVRTDFDSAEVARMRAEGASNQRLDIRRLASIELSRDEARSLGIDHTATGVELYADDYAALSIRERGSDEQIRLLDGTTDTLRLKRFKLEIGIDASRFGSIEISDEEKPLAIAPVIAVTQFRSELSKEGSSLVYFSDAPTLGHFEERDIIRDGSIEHLYSASRTDARKEDLAKLKVNALLGQLVPVYIRLDDGLFEGTTVRRGAEICLWYAPTHAFIAALPARYRMALESELSTIREVQCEKGTVEEACEKIAGKPSFLEVCRLSSGAVNAATASPNPAHGSTRVGFRLSEARRVSITLHDVNGRYLRHLVHEEERAAGEQRVDADLSSVSQGAYLVAVRTDRGEQAVARLIVQ